MIGIWEFGEDLEQGLVGKFPGRVGLGFRVTEIRVWEFGEIGNGDLGFGDFGRFGVFVVVVVVVVFSGGSERRRERLELHGEDNMLERLSVFEPQV